MLGALLLVIHALYNQTLLTSLSTDDHDDPLDLKIPSSFLSIRGSFECKSFKKTTLKFRVDLIKIFIDISSYILEITGKMLRGL